MNPRFFRIRRRGAETLRDDVREEMETHVAMWTDYLVARGTPRDEAERAARERFGVFDDAVGSIYRSAQHRDARMRRRGWWDALRQDVVVGARQLVRQPAFAVLALLTFAIGVGANTAVFSVVQRVLLRPLPYAHSESLAAIWPTSTLSSAELRFIQANAKSFEQVAMFSPGWGIAMTKAGEPRQLDGARVSANFFQTLGIRPLLGRTFRPEENDPGHWDVAILSHALWMTQFGGDPSVLDRIVDMDGAPTRIIGVMPADFEAFQPKVEAWLPLQIDPSSPFDRGQIGLGFGRLAPGATLARATAELTGLADRMRALFQFNDDYARNARVISLHESIVGDSRQTLVVLLGAVTLLVLIAVANVGNLFLVHASGRTRELAIRRAIGASRARLARQLLVQSMLLALGGGTLGIGVAALTLRGLKVILPASLPLLGGAAIDAGVLAFSGAVTIVAGIAFGIAPALFATRVDPEGTLRASAATTGSRAAGVTRNVLVVLEVATATMLVVGAGLMTDSLWRLSRVDLGFDPAHVLTFRLQPSSGQVHGAGQPRAYFDEMTRRIAAVPGVVDVGAAQHLPLSGFDWSADLDVETAPLAPTARHPRVVWRSVVGDYFGAMRIPLRRGRLFDAGDGDDAPQVVIINETMAKRFWPDRDPLGQRIRLGNGTNRQWATIVGVVGDVRYGAADSPAGLEAYRPNAQQHLVFMHYAVRVTGDPLAHVADVQRAIRSIDTTVPIAEVRGLEDVAAQSGATRRTVAELLIAFAALGALLAAVGVYGVISYGVGQRTRELGIRAALGARTPHVLLLVLRDASRMAMIGVVLGGAGALLGTRSLRTLVFGVATSDPVIYVGVAATMLLVAVAAALLPARRAARVDPLTALRAE